MEQTNKRVYALYRVSTMGQVEKDDIPMQKEYCRRFAQQQGWTIIEEFCEKGVSGFKVSAKDRDAIQCIQRAALEKKFDILLVYMFDRLGRKDNETPFIVQDFVAHGIEVWSATEGQQRFDTHTDKLMNYIRYWQANGESLKTSIRTKTRLSQLTEEGHYTGGAISFGYKLVDLGRINKRGNTVYDLAIDEDDAKIVQLIFQKYVFEGFGSQRLSHWLHEQNITKKDGTGFPNTSINRIIKNILYTGVIKNGDARSAPIEALQIIDPAIFDRAQEIMKSRTFHHHDVPLNCKGMALLSGRVFCGHCGNRLTLTTSGGRKHVDDATRGPARVRYQCHYNVRHPGECDGQSGYTVSKLDAAVDALIKQKLSEIKAAPKSEFLAEQKKREVEVIDRTIHITETQLEEMKKEIADYKSEIIRIIRGESKFSAELLNEMLSAAEQKQTALEAQLSAHSEQKEQLLSAALLLEAEYDQLLNWADIYESSSIDAKKMIISQLIKAVYVRKGYDIDIIFNISFEDLQCHTESEPPKITA